MGETVNIKSIADLVAEELFDAFKWNKCQTTDYRWTCVERKRHKNGRKGQHPSDVVFTYDDPYRGVRIHINADLKSYAKSTLATFDLEGTLVSLSQAIECGHKSQAFSDAFGSGKPVSCVDGLLFVYNHDGNHTPNALQDRLEQLNRKSLSLRRNHRIFVIGPERVIYLYSIARDIESRVARHLKDDNFNSYSFYSPELKVSKVKRGVKFGAAPIESMVGPWLFVSFFAQDHKKIKTVVYYDGKGDTQDEFKYLIDAILSFNLLDDDTPIEIAMQTKGGNVPIYFEAARSAYAEENHGLTEDSLQAFRVRLSRISYKSVSVVSPSFIENEMAIIRNG